MEKGRVIVANSTKEQEPRTTKNGLMSNHLVWESQCCSNQQSHPSLSGDKKNLTQMSLWFKQNIFSLEPMSHYQTNSEESVTG